MTSPETRLALANLDAIVRGRTLSIGLDLPVVTVFHTDLRAHRGSPGSGFGPWFSSDVPFDTVVVEMPKAVERLRMMLAMARAALRPGGQLVLIGHNDAGARSAGKYVEEMVARPEVLDTRFHCRAYIATAGTALGSSLSDWRTSYETFGLTIVSYPGIFAHGHLDEGTRLLLSVLPAHPGSRALDVGSGSGVIGAWLRARGVTVGCVDVDAVAVQATHETLTHVEGPARAWASDVYSDVGERYDVIVSNPSFHAGKRRTTEAAARLVLEAPSHFNRGGELWLVANRFLPYPKILKESFGSFAVAAEDRSYRVYRARV